MQHGLMYNRYHSLVLAIQQIPVSWPGRTGEAVTSGSRGWAAEAPAHRISSVEQLTPCHTSSLVVTKPGTISTWNARPPGSDHQPNRDMHFASCRTLMRQLLRAMRPISHIPYLRSL